MCTDLVSIDPHIGHCHLDPIRRKCHIQRITKIVDRRAILGDQCPGCIVKIDPGHIIIC